MHCYACDILIVDPQLDKPTGRYYCEECLEPATEIMLAKMNHSLFNETEEELEEDAVDLLQTYYEESFSNPQEDLENNNE